MRAALLLLLLLLAPQALAAERVVLVDRELWADAGSFTFVIPEGFATEILFCYAGEARCDGFGGTPTPLAVRRGTDVCAALPVVSLPACVLPAKAEESVAEVAYSAYFAVRFLAIGTR